MRNENTVPRRGPYDPTITTQLRTEMVSQIVQVQQSLINKNTAKTDLNDTAAVRAVADAMTERCIEAGCLPNFEIFAASLGCSRQNLYKFCKNHPESETAELLDTLRTGWAGARQMASDRGAVDPTMSIFVLLNSGLDFSNRHDVLIESPSSPLDDNQGDTAAIREKYLASLPEDAVLDQDG